MKDPERDPSLDRMLERTLRSAPSLEDCPDAEALAAWSEDALRGQERSGVERHISDCVRCQTQLAAMARMHASERFAATGKSRLRRSWILPLAGAAAAAGLWFVVQSPSVRPAAPDPPPTQAPAEPQPPARMRERSEPPPRAGAARQSRQAEAKEESAGQAASNVPAAPPPPAALQAPAPSAVEERVTMSTAAAADAVAITGLAVERSADGRVTWKARTSALLAQVAAGASPSASVIWLVGRQGLVLVTTDGQTWHRRPFPELIDLTAVQAPSATAASVVAADGRVFTTADGGATWLRR